MEVKKQLISLLVSIVVGMMAIVIFTCSFPEEQKSQEEQPIVKEEGNVDSAGRNHGLWKGYYANGKEGYVGTYQNGEKEGEWKYFDVNGQLTTTESYKHGLKTGNVLIYSDGKLYDQVSYVNGKKEGKHIHYNKNGTVNYSQEYKNDSMTGDFAIYSSSGVLTQKGTLKNAKNIGEWRMYNDDGVLTEINIYDSSGSSYRAIKLSLNQDTLSDEIIRN